MTHRNGSGTRIDNIDVARAEWIANGRTVSTYPNKTEYDAWVEDFGQLVEAFPDGQEVRQHATLKASSRGGTRKIVHNCVIVGNPAAYVRWLADPRPISQKGWYAQWTYYHNRRLAIQLNHAHQGTRLRPVSLACIETGKSHDMP